MKLHTVFITYNRLDLTRQAIESYLETVSVPYTYLIVDNCSTDATKDWLLDWDHPYISLTRNRYPGYACNQGWERAPEDATFLHRADNDFAFLPGWCEQVQAMFETKKIGQVGLRTHEEEDGGGNGRWNVGGNCVIRRELWDQGLRYDERPWPEFPPGYSEDSFFSPAVEQMKNAEGHNYTWKRVKEPAIRSLSQESWDDAYYASSWQARGMTRPSDSTPATR